MIEIDRSFACLLAEGLACADRLFGVTARYTIESWSSKVVLKVFTPLPVMQAALAADKLDDWARLNAARSNGRLLITIEYE